MNNDSNNLRLSTQSGMAYAHWKNQANSLALGVASIRQGAIFAGIGTELTSEDKAREATEVIGLQASLEPRLTSPDPDNIGLPVPAEHMWNIDMFADVSDAADAADAAAADVADAAIDVADIVDIVLAIE